MVEPQAPGNTNSPDGTTPEQVGQTGENPQWTWLARIRRPQGRKGEVFADILTDFPEKFADRRRLWLILESNETMPMPPKSTDPASHKSASEKGTGFSPYINPQKTTGALAPTGQSAKRPSTPREVTLSNHWLHKGGIILHFSGIDSINDAETLAALIVAIPQTERAPLAEDETYIGDLIGCILVDVAGAAPQAIGEIEEVDRTAGPVALLVVRGAAGEILIPFAKSYLRKIDLAAKRVEMSLPEGLVDLNSPEKL